MITGADTWWKSVLSGKMQAEGIKNFSDAELQRVFGGTVANVKNIAHAKDLISRGLLMIEEVQVTPPSIACD